MTNKPLTSCECILLKTLERSIRDQIFKCRHINTVICIHLFKGKQDFGWAESEHSKARTSKEEPAFLLGCQAGLLVIQSQAVTHRGAQLHPVTWEQAMVTPNSPSRDVGTNICIPLVMLCTFHTTTATYLLPSPTALRFRDKKLLM